MTPPGGRHDQHREGPWEGSIYQRRDGRYAGYVWITTLSGERRRKYV